MRKNSRLFRLSTSVALAALLCNAGLPAAMAQVPPASPAQPEPQPPPAQPAPAPPMQVIPPDQNQGDPPDRVGRIAYAIGAVSFRTSADTQWSPATANYPVSSGNVFWTEPASRAQLEISASHIDLSGQTEFDVTTLDAGGLQAVAQQGEFYLHLADLAPNEVWAIQTPRGQLRLTQAGRYGIVVGSTEQPTQITVLEGAATLDGPGVSLTIGASQTATVTGNGPFEGTIGPVISDAFLAARLAAERPPPQPPAPVPARLQYVPGVNDLAGYGQWGEAPDYGEVWYPSVGPGWAPYEDGHWAYVMPWGWTWVDSAPWGFAPFHYGRWARFGGRWGWIAGDPPLSGRPVYAPALVTFIGLSAGIAIGAAIAHGGIGWVPLGPGEAYHPWYHASGGYIRQINTGHVRDPAAIGNSVALNTLMNRGAAREVPASVMLGSLAVRGAARPIPAQAFATAHPVIGEQPIRPTAGTLGVTPAVAHQLNLQSAAGFAAPRVAPGSVVRVQEPGAAHGLIAPPLVGRPGEPVGVARPGEPLGVARPGELPGAPHPGEPVGVPRPGEPVGVARPGEPIGAPHPGGPVGVARPGEPIGAPRPGEPGVPGPLHPPAPEALHAQPPRVAAPEPPHPAPLPQVERPSAPPPRVERPPSPLPSVEEHRPPPPRMEAPRPPPPPPPRMAPPRPPPPPPPHAAPPRPPPPERRPGER